MIPYRKRPQALTWLSYSPNNPTGECFTVYVNGEYVGDYRPQGNELDTWSIEQRLVTAALLPDHLQTIGQRIEIFFADSGTTAAARRMLRAICSLE